MFLTSPGLLLAARADWRSTRSRLLLGAAGLALVPTLLYYGGGWLQYGYRYFLDSVPFVSALCGLARGSGRADRVGMARADRVRHLVMGFGVYWAYIICPGFAG